MPEQPHPSAIAELVHLFKLLADDSRLRILFNLVRSPELNVRTLCDLLGQSQPAVSHHLALLRVDGLIEARRSGKHNFYRMVPARLEELLHTLFANAPGEELRLKFEKYELVYAPVEKS